MALMAKDPGGSEFEPIEEGMFHAVCYSIIDLGTQYNKTFNKSARRVLITWEIPNQRLDIKSDDGQTVSMPRAISKEYTLSLHEKASLRKDLESWRGKRFTETELKGFNVFNVIGANCTIQVLHHKKIDSTGQEKTYANIVAIMPIMDKNNSLDPENPKRMFSFEESSSIPQGLPNWIASKLLDSEEMQDVSESNEEIPPIGTYDDDIPF